MNKQEYLNKIKNAFYNCFRDDNDRDNYDNIKEFNDYIRCDLKLEFSNVYHANGIGNNNERTIYLGSYDEDGFYIKKNICKFYYCNGIYGGRFHSLLNMDGSVIAKLGEAR